MVFNIQFQLCGLVVILLVAILYIKKRTSWLYTDRIFGFMLLNNIACLVFDIASIITINYRNSIPEWVNEAVCKGYLILLSGVAYINLIYLLADLFRNKADFLKRLRVISIIMLPVLGAYFFLPINYYVNVMDSSIYSEGPVVIYTYIVCIVLLLISAVHLWFYHERISNMRKNPVLIIIIAFIVAAVIQFLNNRLLIVGFAVSIAVLLVYMFMENPIDKIDAETNLYNYNMLKDYIDQNYNRKTPFFMLAVNIQNYSSIVDTFGIQNTNELLSNFAKYLKLIKGVESFRMGEHRFAVIGPMKGELYQKTIWKINNVSDEEFEISNTKIMVMTNICVLNESDLLNNSDEVIFYINTLLLDKKYTDRIRVVNDYEISEVNRAHVIEDTIKWALENDNFEVYYQPIYSISKRCFQSAEALVRLWDENGEYVSPDDFIPVAEHNGSITEIGLLIIEKVCRFINEYHPDRYGIEFIDVNLSVVQCMQSSLADNIIHILKKYNIPLEFIHFEITETVMSNTKRTLVQNMQELICMGSAFYLDDYGSVYANLSFLVELPFKATKLDKQLVWSYFKNNKGKIATEFAVDMLKSLGMEIIAEGVETKEQLDKLSELNIDYIQGFFFSKAVKDVDLINFLINHKEE